MARQAGGRGRGRAHLAAGFATHGRPRDGLRPIGGNRFLQAEGTSGRITRVTIEGDVARIETLREGLQSSPGVTLIGDTAYAVEGKINYLIDPQLRGKDPGPFRALAIPLPR